MEEKDKKIVTMTPQQKLNPIGANLLHEYYAHNDKYEAGMQNQKIRHHFYTINDPKDIPIIMSLESKEQMYGMIIVTGGRHRTPVIVKGKEVIILESLGTSKSKVGVSSVAQISIAINSNNNSQYDIYAPEGNRQVDSVSCGTDSFLALKEGLRLGDKLFEYIKNQPCKNLILGNKDIIDQKEKNDLFFNKEKIQAKQFETLPAEIAKYSQSITTIKGLKNNTSLVKVNATKHNKEQETIIEYANRHKSSSIIHDGNRKKEIEIVDLEGKGKKVELKATKEIANNATLEQRRQKHLTITTNLAERLSDEEINNIIKESTGIDLILSKGKKTPIDIFSEEEKKHIKKASSNDLDKIIKEFIEEEKYNKRDNKTGIAPDSKHSLREIALTICYSNLGNLPTDGMNKKRKQNSIKKE